MLPKRIKTLVLSSVLAFGSNLAWANCNDLPSFQELKDALDASGATDTALNGGFGLNMWGVVSDRLGVVCAVAFSGAEYGDQWPGSRVIAAEKASAANLFSLPGLALSTANLYAANQPGGNFFNLQFSNLANPDVTAAGSGNQWGTSGDIMVGKRPSGIIVFGGGFPLYNSDGVLVGGLGVSGDTSCKDHNYGWRVRNALALDFVPGGVNPDADRPDNIIYDMGISENGNASSPSQFGHVDCQLGEKAIAEGGSLPVISQVAP